MKGRKPAPAAIRVLHGARSTPPGVRLRPDCPAEPRWADLLPGEANRTLRADCARTWAGLVPDLDAHGVLARVDEVLLVDACVCAARIRQCERALSRDGLVKDTDRGPAKNPLTTVVAQYRTQLRAYIAELGLSPSARARLPWDLAAGNGELEALFTAPTPAGPRGLPR